MNQDKFVSPFAEPSAAERELLNVLAEECAEVIQRATKMARFGRMEIQPGQSLKNAQRLGLEVGDLLVMIERCTAAGLIDAGSVEDGRINKAKQLAKYLQHQSNSVDRT
jgi:hypothetical protein